VAEMNTARPHGWTEVNTAIHRWDQTITEVTAVATLKENVEHKIH
jgi:hypothetical protein